jgi:L-threonylcarbamoyladenylate synthase
MDVVDKAIAAIQAGHPVVLPTDTVYGLVASPYRDEPAWRIYRLKQRPETNPIALLAVDLETLFECVPELRGRTGLVARALLPGPYTLIFPNPAHRLRWLTGENENAIGIRVPALSGLAAEVLATVGVVAATSANRPGGPDPSTLVSVPEEIRAGAGAVVDGGALPGTPSTVLDLTGEEPRVLREGVHAAEALRRLGSPVRSS